MLHAMALSRLQQAMLPVNGWPTMPKSGVPLPGNTARTKVIATSLPSSGRFPMSKGSSSSLVPVKKLVLKRPAGFQPQQRDTANGAVKITTKGAVKITTNTKIMTGSRALMGGLTRVEQQTVQKPEQYRPFEVAFTAWCVINRRSVALPELDATLVDYLDVLLERDYPSGHAEKVVAAVLYYNIGSSRASIPRSVRGLRGCRKARPAVSRLPLVDDIVCGIASCFLLLDSPHGALAVFAGAKLYLRLGELVNAQCEDLGVPQRGFQKGIEKFTLTIAPQSRGKQSKIATYDDTVVVDEPAWLGELLGELQAGRPQGQPLFKLTMENFQGLWKRATQMMSIKAHPYQLRHSGASSDL